MIIYSRANSDSELKAILQLQKDNLPGSVSLDKKIEEGFVTVDHSFGQLKDLNEKCPHIIAKSKDNLVGYALCMHPSFRDDIDILKPMFVQIEKYLLYPLEYIVMGQVCIDEAYRGKGIFRGLYGFMKEELQDSFDAVITEVDITNSRSLRAHYAIGFKNLVFYRADGHDWDLMIYNWKN